MKPVYFDKFFVSVTFPSLTKHRGELFNECMYINLILIFLCIWNVDAKAQTQTSKKCDSKSQGILQLKNNFDEYYKDYDCFFQIFNKSEKLASSCENQKELRDFLSLAPAIKGNAEVGEAFNKTVENLLISQPKCFLTAAEKLNQMEQHSLIKSIKNPLFHSEDEINKAMTNLREVSKQSRFIITYFQ